MDRQTRAYFSGTSEKAQVTRRGQNSVAYRQDLHNVWTTPRGRQFRTEYMEEKGTACHGAMPDAERRALSQAILWAQWKEQQTGKPVPYHSLPPCARPVVGNLNMESV